jgi:hypothetical protein
MSNKRALLVGINRYGDPRNDLPSCVADAEAFRGLLIESYGFDPADMRFLKDEEATVANVDDGLKWLLADATASDRLVFYFSGHGYQMLEGDSVEETLVLRDGFYKDDLLSALSQGLPQGTLTMAFDSCHSGGTSKVFLRPTAAKGHVEPVRVKCWDPGPEEPQAKSFGGVKTRHRFGAARPTRPPAATRAGKAKGVGGDEDEAGQQPLNGLLLAACSENETASASSSATRGLSAFTFALLKAIEEHGPHSGTIALRDHAEQTLRALGFRQTPVVHAPEEPSGMGSRGFITLPEINASQITSLVHSPSTELLTQLLKETNVMNQMNQSIDTRAINDALVGMLPGLLRALQAGNGSGNGSGNGNGANGGAGQEKLPIIPIVTAGITAVNLLSGLFRKNKDFEAAIQNASPVQQVDSASQDKNLAALFQLLPVVFTTVSNIARKDFQPVPTAEASDKALFDTLLRLAPTLIDLAGSIARKDFEPVATAEDKSIQTVLRAVMQHAPRILAQAARAT